MPEPQSKILIDQPEGVKTRIDVRLEDETVWLSHAQLVDLFRSSKQKISLQIRYVYEKGELAEGATFKEYLTVHSEGASAGLTNCEFPSFPSPGWKCRPRSPAPLRLRRRVVLCTHHAIARCDAATCEAEL